MYYRNLKRIGIGVILVSLGNLVYELLIRIPVGGIRGVFRDVFRRKLKVTGSLADAVGFVRVC